MRARDEGVRADVDGHPEAVARRVDEPALEILGSGKRDGVDEDVEPSAKRVANLREHAREVVVGTHVALGDERTVDGRGEIADVLLDALALVGERHARPLVGEALCDRPCDRALIRDAEDERLLALEPAGHPSILNG